MECIGWGLSKEDAEKICRYAPWEMNAFPAWLDILYEQYPTVVLDILVQELNWEIANCSHEKSSNYIISRIKHIESMKPLKLAIAPAVLTAVSESTISDSHLFEYCLDIILKSHSVIDDRDVVNVAKALAIENENATRKAIGFAIWINLESISAIDALTEHLESIEDGEIASAFAMTFITALFGT
ncbi:MAG: hypothetical protein IIB05_11610, partial [Bacteroidetes bacterium]|nr:hypothetical protein [Bacteroidota bacterium]